jgi:hypothetical protein
MESQQQQGKGEGFGETNQRGAQRIGPMSTGSSAGHDDALDTTKVWESEQLEPASAGTLTTLTTTTDTNTSRNPSSPLHPGVFQPPPQSPVLAATAANLPSDDSEAAVSDDSDFDIIDPDTPSQLDGAPERTGRNHTYVPTAITELYPARPRKGKQIKQESFDDEEDEDWDAVPAAYNPAGPSRMEGGNDYDQPEWRQAGPNADAQDLAGPGEHGMLECTVTKPQKEGEGTQNVYVSYLVTTDVSITAYEYTKPQLIKARPTSNPSKPPTRPHAADSPTSSSSTRRSSRNTRNAPSHLYLKSRTCRTFAATVSAPTSQPVARIPSSASSSA